MEEGDFSDDNESEFSMINPAESMWTTDFEYSK